MKLLLSPAKSLDYTQKLPTTRHSQPLFLKDAERLNRILRKKSSRSLSKLMGISQALGQLNFERNQEWHLPFTSDNARPAIYAFSGDVYRGIGAFTLDSSSLEYMQSTVRIISGLYGLLKPLDLIQAYRLEMGTKLPIGKHKNLYEFWRNKISQYLNEESKENELLLNLASNEYYKAINTKALKNTVVTPVFKDFKNGQLKTIMTFAKLARGYMTRYCIQTNANNIEDIKGFNYEGYVYDDNLSQGSDLVFVR